MDLENQCFDREKCEEMAVEGESFFSCRFENALWTEEKFSRASFVDCVFVGCQLQSVEVLGCRFQNCVFEESKLVGIDFCKCERRFFSVGFKSARLMGCNFAGIKLDGTKFQGSTLSHCIFTEARLCRANFKECNLEGSLFHHTDLSGANFLGACQYVIDPRHNRVAGAQFNTPEVLSLLDSFDISIDKG